MSISLLTITVMIPMIALSATALINSYKFGLFSPETTAPLLIIGLLFISFGILWKTANWLNKSDTNRTEAESQIKTMNARLKLKVEERTAAFQKSEQKYRLLIEHASDSIYTVDLDGNFTDVNASMCKLTGYTRAELMQLNIRAIIDPEDVKATPIQIDLHQFSIRERKFIHKSGLRLTVEASIKRFDEHSVLVIARDITDRKKLETDLIEAELKFRTLAEKSVIGIYIVQDEKYIYVNPRFADTFGYKPEELINAVPVETIIHESYRAIAVEHVRQRIAGEIESVHYEAMGKKKDGTSNWIELYGNRTIIGGRSAIIGSMIDITERKKAEDELRLSERKYKLLFESSPMPMWMIAKANGAIIAANQATVNHYGYTREELLQMNVRALRSKEDHEDQKKGYKRNVNSSSKIPVVRHLKKDGTIMLVQIVANDIVFDGKRVRLSLTNDITEKVKAEAQLQTSQANLQTILNTTDIAYFLFDTALQLLSFNQKAALFIKEQYHRKPQKGDHLSDFFPPERTHRLIKFATNALKGTNAHYEVDYPQADGSVFWYFVSSFPITNDKKEVLGVMIALYDITERKRAEQELNNAYERIQNQISSIRDMAWKQSHLIRSPLANLKGLTAMLVDDPSDADVLNLIQQELNRMDNVIREMANEASDHDK